MYFYLIDLTRLKSLWKKLLPSNISQFEAIPLFFEKKKKMYKTIEKFVGRKVTRRQLRGIKFYRDVENNWKMEHPRSLSFRLSD